MSVSTATQSAPPVCNWRSVCCAAALFERYAMAIRAPSWASRSANPLPIPRLPPVTSATRFLSDILSPANPLKDFQYSLGEAGVLLKPCNDDGHVVGLLGRSRPFFGCCHQRFRHH